jgi:hypothetical protein
MFAIISSLACTKDKTSDTRLPVDGMVTLKVKVTPSADEPHLFFPGSRADIPGTADESKITTLRLLIFKRDKNELEKFVHVTFNPDGSSGSPAWSASDRSLRVVVSPGPKEVYCLANWSDTPSSDMPEISDKTVGDTASLNNIMRQHSSMPVNPPVMSGRLKALTLVGNEQGITIPIKRQVAKLAIYPMISSTLKTLGADVKISGIKFTNIGIFSLIFETELPHALAAEGEWDQTDFVGPLSEKVTAVLPGEAVKYPHEYYLPEHVTDNEKTITNMTIKVIYNGKPTYYTMHVGELAQTTIPPLRAVRRNRCYNYYLTIQGTGSAVATRTIDGVQDPTFMNVQCERLEIE